MCETSPGRVHASALRWSVSELGANPNRPRPVADALDTGLLTGNPGQLETEKLAADVRHIEPRNPTEADAGRLPPEERNLRGDRHDVVLEHDEADHADQEEQPDQQQADVARRHTRRAVVAVVVAEANIKTASLHVSLSKFFILSCQRMRVVFSRSGKIDFFPKNSVKLYKQDRGNGISLY